MLTNIDPTLASLLLLETKRQKETLSLIPSENVIYDEVKEILASDLSQKYSEGYVGKRYYNGNKYIDQIEKLAIDRTCQVFGMKYANVQVLSGSPANQAIYMSVLKSGDTVLGFDLSSGGHLTHGAKVNFSGKYYNSVTYSVDPDTKLINFDIVEQMALKYLPKLIICGTTSYTRKLEFDKFASIRDKVREKTGECYLLADISHISMLVASGLHSSPSDYADFVMTTTHKGLRGPRGAVILTDNKELAKRVDRSVFPGLQGGPHNATTAGIAFTMLQAQTPEFHSYCERIIKYRKLFEDELLRNNFNLITNGSDNHMLVIDLRNKNLTGKQAADRLEEKGIIVNANSIPFDTSSPMNPSGIRIGTPWIAAMNMEISEVEKLIKKLVETLINY